MGLRPAVRAGQFWLCLGSHVPGPLGVSSHGGFKGRGPWGPLALLQANPGTASVLHPLRAPHRPASCRPKRVPQGGKGTLHFGPLCAVLWRKAENSEGGALARPPGSLGPDGTISELALPREQEQVPWPLWWGQVPVLCRSGGRASRDTGRVEGPVGEDIPSVSLALHA